MAPKRKQTGAFLSQNLFTAPVLTPGPSFCYNKIVNYGS